MIAIMLDLNHALRKLSGSSFKAAAGDTIFRRNDAIRFLHLIEAGSANLVRYSTTGALIVMQRASPGMVLAESSLFAERYHCDAVVAADLRAYRIRIPVVNQAMRDNSDLAIAMSSYLAREVQRMRIRSEILALKTVRARLDAWFTFNGAALPQRGAWKGVADDIGVSPEALYRELATRKRR